MGFVENVGGKIDVAQRGNKTQIFIRLARDTVKGWQIATTPRHVEKPSDLGRRHIGIRCACELSSEQELRPVPATLRPARSQHRSVCSRE